MKSIFALGFLLTLGSARIVPSEYNEFVSFNDTKILIQKNAATFNSSIHKLNGTYHTPPACILSCIGQVARKYESLCGYMSNVACFCGGFANSTKGSKFYDNTVHNEVIQCAHTACSRTNKNDILAIQSFNQTCNDFAVGKFSPIKLKPVLQPSRARVKASSSSVVQQNSTVIISRPRSLTIPVITPPPSIHKRQDGYPADTVTETYYYEQSSSDDGWWSYTDDINSMTDSINEIETSMIYSMSEVTYTQTSTDESVSDNSETSTFESSTSEAMPTDEVASVSETSSEFYSTTEATTSTATVSASTTSETHGSSISISTITSSASVAHTTLNQDISKGSCIFIPSLISLWLVVFTGFAIYF